MTEAEIIKGLKTCTSIQKTVAWIKEYIENQEAELFLAGYRSGKSDTSDKDYMAGYEAGVKEMAGLAKEVLDTHIDKCKNIVILGDTELPGSIVQSAINYLTNS